MEKMRNVVDFTQIYSFTSPKKSYARVRMSRAISVVATPLC